MNLLEPGTILLLSTLLSLMMAVVLISISRGVENVIHGVNSWATAYLFYAASTVLLLTRSLAPAFISIVLANTLLGVGTLFIYRGFRRFLGRTVPLTWPAALLVAYVGGLLFFTYGVQHYDARVLIVVTFFIVVLSATLRLIRSETERGRTPGIRLVVLAMLLAILSAVVRGIDALAMKEAVHGALLGNGGRVLPYYLLANALSIVFLSVALVVLIHERLREELHELAARDPLTGVLTRRVVLDFLDKTVARLRRTGESFSLMMFDLDHFKEINDTYGHLAGDEVLSVVVRAIERSLRTEDIIGRYGGEEFLVVMGQQDPEAVAVVAERIRRLVEQTAVAYGSQVIRCTVSIGAATITAGAVETGDAPVAVVDSALYEAKRTGRNRVVVASRPAVGSGPNLS